MPKRLWQWMVGIAACGIVLGLARDEVGRWLLSFAIVIVMWAGFCSLVPALDRWLRDRYAAWADLIQIVLVPAWIIVGILLLFASLAVVAWIALRGTEGV